MAKRAPTHRQGPTHPKFKAQEEEARKEYDQKRNQRQRGKYDWNWRRFRLWYLHQFPLCVDCQRQPATEVHHIRGLKEHPEDRLDPEMVQGLCKGCHSKVTRREAQ